MNAWKNWQASLLCGAAVLSIALVPRLKNESNDSIESLTQTSVTAKESIKSLPHQEAGDSLKEIAKLRKNPVIDQWLNAMQSDAFGDQLIFSQLATFEPVMNIMKKGIVSYDRKTLRTQNYRDEEGYDLLVYEIHHPLAAKSQVMAYFDRKPGELPVLKVVFLSGRPGVSSGELVQFENGALSSHKEVAWSEAQSMFDHELNNASTLMSASIH